MATKITAKMLEAGGKQGRLCEGKVKQFKRLYPRGLYVTEKNCLMVLMKRHFNLEDLYWVGDAFLNRREERSLWSRRMQGDKERFAEEFVKYWNRYRARIKQRRK